MRTFGINCTVCRCFEGEICNITTGFCPSGCSNGYTGLTCQDKCPVGNFGRKCGGECHCEKGHDVCDHITVLEFVRSVAVQKVFPGKRVKTQLVEITE